MSIFQIQTCSQLTSWLVLAIYMPPPRNTCKAMFGNFVFWSVQICSNTCIIRILGTQRSAIQRCHLSGYITIFIFIFGHFSVLGNSLVYLLRQYNAIAGCKGIFSHDLCSKCLDFCGQGWLWLRIFWQNRHWLGITIPANYFTCFNSAGRLILLDLRNLESFSLKKKNDCKGS